MSTSNRFDEARAAFQEWREDVSQNFYTGNRAFQNMLRFFMGDEPFAELQPQLEAFGETCARVIDPAAEENDRIGNHPQLVRWNDLGERIEEIRFHPSYHVAGRAAIESGILSLQAKPGHALKQAALFFLLSHCGEMGHACPIACTSGLIRALQAKAPDTLRDRYLSGLLSADYDRRLVGAQFITEIQGGSDVGANACTAVPVVGEPGVWRISGEKWFCSVANADLFLISARPQNAPEGTRGLGAFMVPRKLDDGSLNGFSLRRLKDKFGTRTLATGEIDFDGAIGYQIGAIDEGFKIIIEMVLNVSRWFNAIGSCGLMQRGYLEARAFANRRKAFGAPIIRYPLVQEALAEIKASLYAGLASTLYLSRLIDRMDLRQATDAEKAVHRLLVNINKYSTSIAASLALRRAQEILGGNGAVETFSVIPRLYRDSVVYESWEGSHNVLCLQVLRDCRKYGFHAAYFDTMAGMVEAVNAPALAPIKASLSEMIHNAADRFSQLLDAKEEQAQLFIRREIDAMAHLFQASVLLSFADWEIQQKLTTDTAMILQFFVHRYLESQYDPGADPEYISQLKGLC
ncbi:MAG: acyl-CoA dehydrogenase family protein [candidate division KSB1 bacterium]|nr:acyl-CoA dehydrogenase family protein [candidate division KSB1 bacterium]